MRAELKRFSAEEYTKEFTEKWFFGKNTIRGVDWQAYYQAIKDFLTTLGPTRVIGIQSPAGDYRYAIGGVTDVWYWVE